MHKPDSKDAAVLLDAEALGKIQRVEISVPDENAPLSQERRNLCGIVITKAERQRRAALVKAFCVGDAEDAHPRNCLQSLDQPSQQSGFVFMRRTALCLHP